MEQERQRNLWAALVLGVGLALTAALVSKSTGLALYDEGAEAAITAQLGPRCDLTIAQFGPGERWLRHHHVYECVTAARELPPHVLTHPLQR